MSSLARQNQIFMLPDGRQLGYAEYGNQNGTPLLYFHGYPSCRLEAYALDEIARRQNVRLIALDRPGFGLSTPQLNRRILDWPLDVMAFANGTQISRFAVIGISGGGPYAMACAYVLPQKMLNGVGIFASGPPWVAGAHHNSFYRRAASVLASYWPTGFRITIDVFVHVSRWLLHLGPVTRWIDQWLEQAARKKGANEQAVTNSTKTRIAPVSTTTERRLKLVNALLDEPFAQGGQAAVDEARLLSSSDWGFLFEHVQFNPVRVWHGVEDKNSPVAMIRYMVKKLPHCVYRELEGETHYTMFPHFEEAIAELIAERRAA